MFCGLQNMRFFQLSEDEENHQELFSLLVLFDAGPSHLCGYLCEVQVADLRTPLVCSVTALLAS